MSTMVSARIPNDVYERGVKKLKHIDSNVSDLVRAAFEYVIESEKLPSENNIPIKPGKKELVGKEARKFNQMFSLEEETLNLPENFDFKEELSKGMKDNYEALS
jgi:antitoxin component of RelBE/YafQ-DinJ toxin-antitoxin module